MNNFYKKYKKVIIVIGIIVIGGIIGTVLGYYGFKLWDNYITKI